METRIEKYEFGYDEQNDFKVKANINETNFYLFIINGEWVAYCESAKISLDKLPYGLFKKAKELKREYDSVYNREFLEEKEKAILQELFPNNAETIFANIKDEVFKEMKMKKMSFTTDNITKAIGNVFEMKTYK